MTDLGSNLDEPAAAPAPRVQKAKAQGLPQTTRIMLEENDTIPPGGLFLSVNGRAYRLLAGEVADVPNFLIEVLDHAVMSAPVIDPNTQKVTGWRDRLRYPYRLMK